MYNLVENWMSVIILLALLLISIQITISNNKGPVIKLINTLITIIILVAVVVISQNKFMVEKEATIKANAEFESSKTKKLVDKREAEKLKIAKEEEKQKAFARAMYKKEKNFIIKNIIFALDQLKEIESLNEDRYETINEEDYLFDKYKRKSSKVYASLKNKYKEVEDYQFQSKLSVEKVKFLRAFKSAKEAGYIYYKVFYKEQDISYPSMVSTARNARFDLIATKKSLEYVDK